MDQPSWACEGCGRVVSRGLAFSHAPYGPYWPYGAYGPYWPYWPYWQSSAANAERPPSSTTDTTATASTTAKRTLTASRHGLWFERVSIIPSPS